MPIYEYRCADYHEAFSLLRSSSDRNIVVSCPLYDGEGTRVILSAPYADSMDKNLRKAYETNEHSRHEPQTLTQYKERHGAGCPCCSSAKKAAKSGNDKMKTAGSRPWMLSH